MVKDSKRLETEIIPIFFNHKNYTSFSRQLNFYGFEKVGFTINLVQFKHKHFLQDRPDLLSLIKRSTANDGHGKEIKQLEQRLRVCEEKIDVISNIFDSKIDDLEQIVLQKALGLEDYFERQQKKRRQHTTQISKKKKKKNHALMEEWEENFVSFYFS